jgi:hypothetical protein
MPGKKITKSQTMWDLDFIPLHRMRRLDDGNMLFLSINNENPSKTKTKSYGNVAEMGKILSVVDFVKSKK